MPIPHYPVLCSACQQPATFKIAARWSDGLTQELKTYALTCAACLAAAFRVSCARQADCCRAAGETLDPPGVYELARGERDVQLRRREELERASCQP